MCWWCCCIGSDMVLSPQIHRFSQRSHRKSVNLPLSAGRSVAKSFSKKHVQVNWS